MRMRLSQPPDADFCIRNVYSTEAVTKDGVRKKHGEVRKKYGRWMEPRNKMRETERRKNNNGSRKKEG